MTKETCADPLRSTNGYPLMSTLKVDHQRSLHKKKERLTLVSGTRVQPNNQAELAKVGMVTSHLKIIQIVGLGIEPYPKESVAGVRFGIS